MTQASNRRAAARADLERLESDVRVLSPVGIERAAWGWDRHERDQLAELLPERPPQPLG